METIEIQDALSIQEDREEEQTFFGKPPQPWQLRNSWVKPKRKRKSRKVEVDLWAEES